MTLNDQPGQNLSGAGASDVIVARAGTYYRNTRYLITFLLIVFAAWFLYDGFVRWPASNRTVDDLEAQQARAREKGDDAEQQRLAAELKGYSRHTASDIRLQKILGFGLPPLAILLLGWALYKSRDAYRLEGTKLSVPGHPTIDLDDIKSVNNDLWDRKGIVWLQYETTDGQSGEMRLDDFVYQRPPTDAIYERIAAKFGLDSEDEDKDDEIASGSAEREHS